MVTVAWVTAQFPGLSDVVAFPDGGQKWVFAATHPSDGSVVLKLIKPTTNAERIVREVLAVDNVQSRRVPRVMENGVLPNTPWGQLIWLREQRIDGPNLREILRNHSAGLEQSEVLRLTTHMLEALADASKARIVHRDVKPENIVRSQQDGSYWLLDFGIARHLDLTSLTATGLGGPGTLGYAPPEQFRNLKRDLDGRADLFALAVTLAECLTGKHPYRDGARDPGEVISRIENTTLTVPVPAWDKTGEFRDLIVTMGQRRPDCRPASASDALAWAIEIAERYT